MGEYTVPKGLLDQITNCPCIDFNAEEDLMNQVLETSEELMTNLNYEPLQKKDKNEYLYTRAKFFDGGDEGEYERIGDVRVKWERALCSQTTLIAQQIKDPNTDCWTLRPWNPNK